MVVYLVRGYSKEEYSHDSWVEKIFKFKADAEHYCKSKEDKYDGYRVTVMEVV